MATTVPYTWTPARVQQAWGAAPPGLWWMDYKDPAYAGGVTAVWRALPYWGALDFGYTRDRKLLILVAGPHDNGLSAVLRVYRCAGDPNDPTVVGYTELEASGVSGATLAVRGSGEVDVFYTKAGVLYHALSQDQGETFLTPTAHSLFTATPTAFVPSQAAYQLATGADLNAKFAGGFVTCCHLRGGGLCLVLAGRPSGGAADDNYLVRADWDAAGEAWSFGSVARIDAGGTRNVIDNVQCQRDGDPLLLGWGKRVRNLSRDGTFTLVNTLAGFFQAAGIDEATNQMVSALFKSGGPTDKTTSIASSRFVAATPQWAFVGECSFALGEYLPVWAKHVPTNPVTTAVATLFSSAGKIRMNSARRWEYLHLNRSETPELVRFTQIAGDGSPATRY